MRAKPMASNKKSTSNLVQALNAKSLLGIKPAKENKRILYPESAKPQEDGCLSGSGRSIAEMNPGILLMNCRQHGFKNFESCQCG